jgi:hypothetical protein
VRKFLIAPSSIRLVLLAVAASVVSACSGASSNAGSNASAAPSNTAASTVVSVPSAAVVDLGGATLPKSHELLALQQNCQICHSFDMVYSQRLSKPTWTAEVTKMMKFGSPLPKRDKAAVVAYLAKYLGPSVPRANDRATAVAPVITYSAAPVQQ